MHLEACEPSAAVHLTVRRTRLAPGAASSSDFLALDPPSAVIWGVCSVPWSTAVCCAAQPGSTWSISPCQFTLATLPSAVSQGDPPAEQHELRPPVVIKLVHACGIASVATTVPLRYGLKLNTDATVWDAASRAKDLGGLHTSLNL